MVRARVAALAIAGLLSSVARPSPAREPENPLHRQARFVTASSADTIVAVACSMRRTWREGRFQGRFTLLIDTVAGPHACSPAVSASPDDIPLFVRIGAPAREVEVVVEVEAPEGMPPSTFDALVDHVARNLQDEIDSPRITDLAFVPAAPAGVDSRPPASPPGSEPSRVRLGLSGQVGFDSGVAQVLVGAFGVYLHAERNGPTGWTPELRVGYEATTSGRDGEPHGCGFGQPCVGYQYVAAYSRQTGKLDLCPLRTENGWISGSLCARAEVGAVHLDPGVSYVNAATTHWEALGGVVRLRVQVTTRKPGERIFFEAESATMLPLRRTHFLYGEPPPGTGAQPPTDYTVPAIGVSLGVAAGVFIF